LRKQQSKYKLLQQKVEDTDRAMQTSHQEYDQLLAVKDHQSQEIADLQQQIAQLQAENVTQLAELTTAKKQARAEADELYQEIEATIAQHTQSLEAVVQSLKSENQQLREQIVAQQHHSATSAAVVRSSISLNSQEEDFYHQERKAIVLDVLKKELKGMPTGTRREHVLADIVANNDISSERDAIVQKVRSVFQGYRRMTPQMERALQSVGFSLVSDTNHHKIQFGGDERYTFVFAKTPSDGRAGKNNASTICRKFL
jgi:vacuolar-type H+-ATPase subunit I/STV1